MLARTAVWGPMPVAFVSVEALLLVAACLAAIGAVLTAWLVIRPGRRDRPGPSDDDDDDDVRRSPSPASLGLDEDPIVAALGIGRGRTKGPKP